MILAEAGETTIVAIVASVLTVVVSQIGAYVLKKTKPAEAPTVEQQLMDEWQQIAVESRRELTECRRERERQDQVIAGLDRKQKALEETVKKQRREFDDFVKQQHIEHEATKIELNQWRDGRRVPEGFRLQRMDP